MVHANRLARHAVAVTAAAALAVLLGAGQSAQAGPSQQQAERVAPMSVPGAVFSAARGDVFTAVVTADGGVVVSKVVDPAAVDETVYASWSLKLSHTRTVQIYDAALAGTLGTVIYLCQLTAPGAADWICSTGGSVLMALIRAVSAPGPNDCLGIEMGTRLDLPPWYIRAGYVDCN